MCVRSTVLFGLFRRPWYFRVSTIATQLIPCECVRTTAWLCVRMWLKHFNLNGFHYHEPCPIPISYIFTNSSKWQVIWLNFGCVMCSPAIHTIAVTSKNRLFIEKWFESCARRRVLSGKRNQFATLMSFVRKCAPYGKFRHVIVPIELKVKRLIICGN